MLRAYYDFRDELTVQDQLVFKGQMLIVPAGMRREMLAVAHATHIGMEGCLRRAREITFWPRMTSELKEYISKCDICTRHRESQSKELLQSWAKVGADLCDLNGRTLIVCCNYYSNFIEVENITNITTRGVCKAFKAMFARYGVPDVLVTDNGPQFASSEFSEFAKMWGFDHVTSSPRYPQSNGKGENAVKTVKRLFKKCQESGESEYLALLDWCNTPTESFGTGPAQRFLGRRCKTRLLTQRSLLVPRYSTERDAETLQSQKNRQKRYYDHSAKELPPVGNGETVYMRLPGQSTWSRGMCTALVGPRSYGVLVGEREFRHNRRHIIRSSEPFRPEISVLETTPQPPPTSPAHTEPDSEPLTVPTDVEQPVIRRSGRMRKPAVRFGDYVPV